MARSCARVGDESPPPRAKYKPRRRYVELARIADDEHGYDRKVTQPSQVECRRLKAVHQDLYQDEEVENMRRGRSRQPRTQIDSNSRHDGSSYKESCPRRSGEPWQSKTVRSRHERSISVDRTATKMASTNLSEGRNLHPPPIRPHQDDEQVVVTERWTYRRPRHLPEKKERRGEAMHIHGTHDSIPELEPCEAKMRARQGGDKEHWRRSTLPESSRPQAASPRHDKQTGDRLPASRSKTIGEKYWRAGSKLPLPVVC